MVEIWKDGKIIGRSRNLRGLRARCGTHLVHTVSIMHGPHESMGVLAVIFEDGACCRAEWASYDVLCYALLNWRNLYGSRLLVDGLEIEAVSNRNQYLKAEGAW